MSLANWLRNGWLVAHKTSPQEIRDLFAVAERDLRDSDVTGLSADTQLALAYNAALQSATAALAAEGFRATRESKHVRTIESLALTVGLDRGVLTRLDAFRKKRNVGDYERAGAVSAKEAEEMRRLARDLRDQVERWLEDRHPGLATKRSRA